MSSVLKEAYHQIERTNDLERHEVPVSIIIPVAERYDDLEKIYQSVASAMSLAGSSCEYIVVVDGGFEKAISGLQQLVAAGEPIKIVMLPRRYGEATAVTVGFEHARGEKLIIFPAYLQIVPEGVTEILRALEEGYDVVVARRHPRIDPWINRVQTYWFNRITRWLTGVALYDLGCGLKGVKRRVVREIQLYGDLHRFLPLLAIQRGFRVTEVPVAQHRNESGMRLYRPGVYLRRLLDILTLVFLFKFTKKPLRFFGLIGAGLFGIGLMISGFLTLERIIGATALADRPLLVLGILLMVLGVQTGSIGLLGEMIIFTHARNLKDYTVEKVLR